MRTPKSILVPALLGAWLAAGPQLASADEPVDQATAPPSPAAALLAQAEDAFVQDSDCGRALPLFQRAYAIEPGWVALNGMATCHELSGRYDLAYTIYERILAEYGASFPPARRARVEQHLADCDAHLARLSVRAAPGGAHVSIDGEDVTRFPVRLSSGAHRVVVTASGHTPLSRQVTLTAGRHEQLDLALDPLPREPGRLRPWIGRGLLVAGGALAVSGGTLLVLAERDFDAFDESVAGGAGPPSMVARDRLVSGERKRDAGYVLLGAGAAAGIGAAILLLWPDAPAHAPRPSIDARAGSLGVGLSWSY